MITISDKLVTYVLEASFEKLPAHVIEVQKQSVLDLFSVMMAATSQGKEAEAFIRYVEENPGEPTATLFGSEHKVSPVKAALANGALAHVLDYEDSHEIAMVHPNSASTVACMALAEKTGGISGKDFLLALVLASDICCRLDLGSNEDLLKYGWNMPPVHGSMGAVFGVGKMLGLDYGQFMDAIALNMSFTSSGQAAHSKESSMRTIREGFAAQSALQSVLLAQKGVHARFDEPLEGKLGYYHMYARDNVTLEKVTDRLGEVYQSEFISFKPWPCCRATHTSVEGVMKLIKEHEIQEHEIEEIHIAMHEVGRMVMEPAEVKYRPKAPGIAKFSMPFILGTMVHDGELTLASFQSECLERPEVLDIADKVTCEILPHLTKEQNKYTDITIRTSRGTYMTHMDFPLGCMENPMSEEQRKEKFYQCAAMSVKRYSRERLDRIYEAVMHLEELKDVRELIALI